MNNLREAPAGGLGRDLALLRALASPESRRQGGLGVVRVAELTGRDKSQVSRALRALTAAGLVVRDPDSRRFQIGWALFALTAGSEEIQMLETAREPMASLMRELDESVHLCVLDGVEVLTLVSQLPHGRRTPGLTAPVVPAHCTSAGRVLLGDDSRSELDRRFAGRPLPAEGPTAQVHSLDDLYAVVAHTRRAGYATVDEELEESLVGASAPVRDDSGRLVAALNVSAPKSRLVDLENAGRATARAAETLSRALGWSGRASRAAGTT